MNRPSGWWTLGALVAIVIAALIGYTAGVGTEAPECEQGEAIAVVVTDRDRNGNGTYKVTVGDCPRLSEEGIVRSIEALLEKPRATTTTTTTTTPPKSTTSTSTP